MLYFLLWPKPFHRQTLVKISSETTKVVEVLEQVNCKVPLFRTKTQGTLHDERSA